MHHRVISGGSRWPLARCASAWIVTALLASGCGEREAVDPPGRSAERATGPSSPERPEPSPREPSVDSPGRALAGAPDAPQVGCALGDPARAHAGEWSALAAARSGFVLAGTVHQDDVETAFVLRLGAGGETSLVTSAALEHPVPADHRRTGPALAASGERAAFALVDGDRRLLFAELDLGAGSETELVWRVLGEGASLRFAPALSAHGAGGWALAYTTEREEDTMRVHAALVEGGAVRGARELRPAAGGSAAPAFVAGAREPVIVFLDPRAGVSVAHRSRASGGAFGDPSVARPINLVTEPPAIAAARIGEAEWLAYTAIGSGATTAVGLVRLDGTASPVALVPGRGYGVLHVSSASLGRDRALFVADSPQGTEASAPRELHVRELGSSGVPGEPVVVRGPSGTAARGRIAHAGQGVIAVSFTEGGAIFASVGRCAM